MKLVYKAVSKDGRIANGIIEAKEEKEAANYLRSHGLIPIEVSSKSNNVLGNLFAFRKKSHFSDLVFFTRQLSSMFQSGLTMMQALNILKTQVQNQQMKEIIEKVVADIQEGSSFSASIAKYPEVFTPIYVALMKAAETGGLVDKVLEHLADNLEKQEKLRQTIKSALMYPIIVIIMMVIVVTIMMLFVVPPLAALYESLAIDLPITTQIVVGLSNLTTNFWPFLIIGGLGGTYLFRRWHKTPIGKKQTDKFLLQVPILGKLLKNAVMAEFTRTFGLLVGTGILVVESLNKSADVVGNTLYKDAVHGVSKSVEKGVTIGDAMSISPLFPSILIEMVKIGENTGKLDESLMRVADYFDREVEQAVKTLTTAMEPLIMVFLGVGVGFLIIAIITPIYGLLSAF